MVRIGIDRPVVNFDGCSIIDWRGIILASGSHRIVAEPASGEYTHRGFKFYLRICIGHLTAAFARIDNCT